MVGSAGAWWWWWSVIFPRFNIIQFSGSCKKWRDNIQEPTEENCHDAVRWTSSFVANGNTCTLEALQVRGRGLILSAEPAHWNMHLLPKRACINHIHIYLYWGIPVSACVLVMLKSINTLYRCHCPVVGKQEKKNSPLWEQQKKPINKPPPHPAHWPTPFHQKREIKKKYNNNSSKQTKNNNK